MSVCVIVFLHLKFLMRYWVIVRNELTQTRTHASKTFIWNSSREMYEMIWIGLSQHEIKHSKPYSTHKHRTLTFIITFFIHSYYIYRNVFLHSQIELNERSQMSTRCIYENQNYLFVSFSNLCFLLFLLFFFSIDIF